MNKRLSESVKVDVGLIARAFATTNFAIGEEFVMDLYRKALFVFSVGSAAMRFDDELDIGVVDNSVAAPAATTQLATLAALAPAARTNLMGYLQVIGGQGATRLGVEFTNGPNDEWISLNGTVFEYDATPDTAAGEWNSDATFVAAVNLAGIGLTAELVGTEAIIRPTVIGERTITLTHNVTLLRDQDILTYEAIAYIEVDASQMAQGATALQAIVDNTSARTHDCAVTLIRGNGRYAPVQAVAESV